MFLLKTLSRLACPQLAWQSQARNCHSVFGFKELIQPEKAENFTIHPVMSGDHEMALGVVKQYFLSEHVFVRSRNMDLNDCALDEYLISLFKQGNTLYAKADDGAVAGLCVNFASSAVDAKNLRHYACYRQDPNVKDFLCFMAKLQETPNLWEAFHQKKIFEIKMLTVLPEYRRQGLAVALAERSKEQALDQGYNVIRMDCINPFDYKVAERCMLQCAVKYPLQALRGLRGPHAPYVRRAALARLVRVYVRARAHHEPERAFVKQRREDLENLIE